MWNRWDCRSMPNQNETRPHERSSVHFHQSSAESNQGPHIRRAGILVMSEKIFSGESKILAEGGRLVDCPATPDSSIQWESNGEPDS